jgi:hypothetical protein
MLALAKPPSMSRGREKHHEGGSARLIAKDCLKYLFMNLKKGYKKRKYIA